MKRRHNKKSLNLLFLTLFFFIPLVHVAQKCATPPPEKMLKITAEDLQRVQRTIDYQHVVRIFIHILRNNDETNAAITDSLMFVEIQRMANFFKPHNICFMFAGFDYINNTNLNTMFKSDSVGMVNELLSNNYRLDAINIYVHSNNFVNGGGGRSYGIPSLAYSVAQASNFNWYHEMGHALGLAHTFETGGGIECPDGSNCFDAGDYVCDTPADWPNSQTGNTGICTYSNTMTINCNGSTMGYNVQTQNIMGYWYWCYSFFSAGQGWRMRFFLEIPDYFLQAAQVPYDDAIAGNVSAGIYYRSAKNNLFFNPFSLGTTTLTGTNMNAVINAGNAIYLNPGTRISPTSGKARLMINTVCD